MMLDVLLFSTLPLLAPQEPPLGANNYEAVRDTVLADPAHAWQSLAWHPDLASGVAAAHAADKPVMLWIMNGHPAGFC